MTGGRTAPRGILAALCVAVTTGYGTLYYAFAVLGPAISEREEWSLTAMTAGFSAASVLTGLVGIPVGREIQRRGPRRVMLVGVVVGALGLVGLAVAPSAGWFVAAMLVCGVAAAALFYPPAFAAITHWYGEQRVRALTALTLVAGFASTIFAPLTTELSDLVGWRWGYVVLGGVLLATVVPLHLAMRDQPWHSSPRTPQEQPDRDVIRSPRFLLLAAGATLVTLAEYASLVGLVPLLVERGLSLEIAAWVLGIGGAGQVVGRLFYPLLARRVGVRGRATAIAVLVAVPIGVLAITPGPAALLLGLSVAAGVGRGLFTLVSATLVSDVWGPERYAALNGVLNAPLMTAGALGPFAGAAVAATTGGYPALFAALCVSGLLGAGLMAGALPRPERAASAVEHSPVGRDV